jgi:nitrite reductase/ring-hydroxylating ferredoxin subunit
MKLSGLLVIFLLLISCKKDSEGRIPDVYVNYHVTLQEFNISSNNGVLLANGGVAGLLIYRRPDNNYVAFDRCSSVNPEQKCAVVPDDPSLTATDPCSGAKFSLYDGTPMKAPAKKPLKQYQVNIINNFEIHVTN